MFSFAPKPPIPVDTCEWVDACFTRLAVVLGWQRMLQALIVQPNNTFFPDPFDRTGESVSAMAARVATYMQIPRDSFTSVVYAEEERAPEQTIPSPEQSSGAAGLYFHQKQDEKFVIGVHAKELQDTVSLVSTIAHELAHVLLLGGALIERDDEDMEPLTDLAVVFLGFGIFGASSAFQFNKWRDDKAEYWRVRKKGYLPEGVWAYALARFCYERCEYEPVWTKELPLNIRVYFKQAMKWLRKTQAATLSGSSAVS